MFRVRRPLTGPPEGEEDLSLLRGRLNVPRQLNRFVGRPDRYRPDEVVESLRRIV